MRGVARPGHLEGLPEDFELEFALIGHALGLPENPVSSGKTFRAWGFGTTNGVSHLWAATAHCEQGAWYIWEPVSQTHADRYHRYATFEELLNDIRMRWAALIRPVARPEKEP